MAFLHAGERCFVCNEKTSLYRFSCYLKCQGCGLVITEYSDIDEADKFYPTIYYGKDGIKFFGLFETIRDFLLNYRINVVKRKTINGLRSILDIGCGNAKFLSAMARLGYSIYGVELPGRALEAARHIQGINLVPVDKLSENSFKEHSFSAITLWHVLEHVAEPLVTLRYCNRWIHREGFLFIEVPNIESWQARIFGDKWLHLDYPRHRFHFTPHSLKLLLDKAGFSVVEEATFSFDMSIFGVIQSILNLFTKPKNCLYNCLHRGAEGKFAMKQSLSVFLGIMLFPAALLFSLIESLLRYGSVIRYVCRSGEIP